MASGGQLSREEALACSGAKHACHIMLYASTSQRFGRNPIRHIILMQMRFDGLLGFPGGLVESDTETLEAGLSRELLEELGLDLPVSVEDYVYSSCAPPRPASAHPSKLILHLYVKKIDEQQILEVERAAVTVARDHGTEVLGMVRVPLYSLRDGRGLGSFLSHSFIGNARSQLVDSLLRLKLVDKTELHRAVAHALKTNSHSAQDLKAALAMTEETGEKRH